MYQTIEDITPEKATKLLEMKHEKQRKINRNRVRLYANEMSDGRWRTTAHGIVIDENGVLVDGYHRLNAIILSNHTVEMSITHGQKENAYGHLDGGQSRAMMWRTGLGQIESAIYQSISWLVYPRGSVSCVDRILKIERAVGNETRMLIDSCSSRRKGKSKAINQVAFVYCMKKSGNNKQISEQYRRFILGDMSDDTWPSIRTISLQFASQKRDRVDSFVRTVMALNNPFSQRVTVRKNNKTIEEARAFFVKNLGIRPSKY